MKPPQGPPQTPFIPEGEPKILSFGEFSHRDTESGPPKYNNLFFYFFHADVANDWTREIYKKKKHYQRFVSEYPEMVELLNKKINSIRDQHRSEDLKPFDGDLYDAYKIMRSYGVSDKDLFS